jgi:predicted dehydrogenase
VTLDVAVVGLGVGEQHALAFARHSGTRVKWLFDLDRARADRLARSLGQGSAASSLDQILADPDVGIVSIASYDDAHHAQTIAALRAGKHVFVEKPICQSLAELRDIAASWRGSGLHLSSNHVLRAAPLYQWLRSLLRDGSMGRAFAVDADYLYGRLEKVTEGWRAKVDRYSVMVGGGIHMVDLVLWLLDARPERVEALGGHIAAHGTAFRYDDYTAAMLSFAGGEIARISANFGCVQPHQHALRVYGTRATFLYDDAGARLHRSRANDVEADRIDLAPQPIDKGALIGPFVDAILNGEDRRDHTQGILDAMAVCFAIDRAKEHGAPVPVEYV